MHKIDIGEWVKSALVIDDQWGEVKNLIQLLSSNGVATSYYNPNPKADKSFEKIDVSFLEKLPKRSRPSAQKKIAALLQKSLAYTSIPKLKSAKISGYNLIFLDIDFRTDGVTQFEFQVSDALGLLDNALSKDCAPYGVVLWSREPDKARLGGDGSVGSALDYIKVQFNGQAFAAPKPLFVIDIEKEKFIDGDIRYSQLIKKINDELHDNKMARLFSHWNKEVSNAAAQTYKDIQNSAETLRTTSNNLLQDEFFNVLKYSTYQHFGFSRQKSGDFVNILSRYSFSYLSGQLYDKLRSNFALKNTLGVFDSPGDSIHGLVEMDKKCKNVALRKVLAELDFCSLLDPVRPDLAEVCIPGLIHCTEDVALSPSCYSESSVYINITPPCDIAQNREDVTLYLSGKIFRATTYAEVKKHLEHSDIKKERYYKTPPVKYGEDHYIAFCFDLRDISRTIGNKKKICPIFILKDSMFTDLMQKFGHHNSRLGARTFH